MMASFYKNLFWKRISFARRDLAKHLQSTEGQNELSTLARDGWVLIGLV